MDGEQRPATDEELDLAIERAMAEVVEAGYVVEGPEKRGALRVVEEAEEAA